MVLFAPLRVVSGFAERVEQRPLDASLLRRGRNLQESSTCDCDDGSLYTRDACDETGKCIHTCIDDGDACTKQNVTVNSCEPQGIVCDDQNAKTIDSCIPATGCVFTCDDGNDCTVDTWDDEKRECVFEVMTCDDNNLSTLDVCVPNVPGLPGAGGCKHFDFAGMALDTFEVFYENVIELLPNNTYFYDDGTTLSEVKIAAILNWINKQVVLKRTPYCYKKTYGRGAGEVLSTCPSSKEKIGGLCYSGCENGFSRQGTFDCQQDCKQGWRDDGLYCRKTEYGRGTG